MPAFLVHGVPDTHRLWAPLRARLRRTDVVAPSLPGFGCALPAGFAATKEAYVDWLVREIERVGAPVDLVGHDWGALLVQRIVSLRPDVVRTWACGNGPADAEYVWHDIAQQWQTPGVGEQVMEAFTPDAMAEGLAAAGVPAESARETAQHIDATMKDAILRLYRSAVRVGAEWQPDVEKITRPALILWAKDDPYVAPRFGERLAARVRGELVMLEGCGHCGRPSGRPKRQPRSSASGHGRWRSGRAGGPRRSRLRPSRRHDPEGTPAVDPVRLEVVVVDGEDRAQRFPPRQVDERRVGKVHRPVVVARHQRVEMRGVGIVDARDGHGPGADEPPRGCDLGPAVADHVEQLREDSRRGREGKWEARERRDARPVPSIVAVEQGENRPGVDQAASEHGASRGARAPSAAPAPRGVRCHREACR